GSVGLWDVATNRAKAKLAAPERIALWGLAFSPDGKMLVTGGQANVVRLWDLADGQNVATFRPSGNGVNSMSVAFAPDGQSVAAGGWGGKVTVWDVATRKER